MTLYVTNVALCGGCATLLNIPNKNIVDVPHNLSRFLVLVTEIITALITETY